MPEQPREFPHELRKALKALSNESRERIFLALTEEGMAYTELLDRMHIRKGSLTHHLRTLQASGLVRNFSRGRLQGPYESYYAPTAFGQSLVNGIQLGMEPPVYQFEWTPNVPAAPWRVLFQPGQGVKEEIIRDFLKGYLLYALRFVEQGQTIGQGSPPASGHIPPTQILALYTPLAVQR
jgi:DNA-binding transcriptional ArsR family regulator